jgi:hypothetical protein
MSVITETEHVIAAHERQIAIIRAMAPTERMERALKMNRHARELLATGFRHRHPEWAEAQVKRAVADRILYARTG